MANIKAKIRSNPNKIVAQTIKVGNIALTDLTDINATNNTDGAMITYNGSTSQFDLSTDIGNENTVFNGGTY
jgi:hypothetical protein